MQKSILSTITDTVPAVSAEPQGHASEAVQGQMRRRAINPRRLVRRFAWLFTLLLLLGAWQMANTLALVDPILLPAPMAVAEAFIESVQDGIIWEHTLTTLHEVLLGMSVGLSIGVTLGYLIARNTLLEDLLTPIIVGFQSTPIVAYAPLLVIWFGTGAESKVVTCALIVFFPMLMNTVVGIRNVPEDLRDLMRVSRATWWQTFSKLEVPAALPVLLTGLKTSVTLAVVGAVVGEFIVADSGLGFWINQARQRFDTPTVFVAMLALALMAGTFYALVALLERRLLAWQRGSRR